jgi:glycosyltransferase involved in cell wall biosynthesis
MVSNMKDLLIKLFISKGVLYRDLFLYPPEHISWKTDVTIDDFDTLKLYGTKQNIIRKMAYTIYRSLNYPRFAYLFDIKDCDLIYSTRGIAILNKKNWITDFEHVSHFVGLDRTKILDKTIQKRILKYLYSDYCKKILPHTKTAFDTFRGIFGSSLENKMEILYHTMKPTELINKFEREDINILFNGNFFHKGGDIALKVFENLNNRYKNLKMTLVSNPPEDIISKYKKKYTNISFYKKGPEITRAKLIENYYMNADIFLYPSQGDTYANPLLLAMNSALPIITTNYFAFPEFIDQEINGFMIHSYLWDMEKKYPAGNIPYNESLKIIKKNQTNTVQELITYIEKLIDDKQKRITMGKKGREILETGKFSLNNRNVRLIKIFNESVA